MLHSCITIITELRGSLNLAQGGPLAHNLSDLYDYMMRQLLRDKGDDQHPLASELARLDFKLNLLLQMVGTLVNQTPAIEAVPVQFNAVGASWQAARCAAARRQLWAAAHPPARRAGADARSVHGNHRQ